MRTRPPADAGAMHTIAVSLCQEGRAGEALTLLAAATEAHPDDPQLWNDLGVAQWITGSLEAACSGFENACRLRPDNHEFAANLGRCLAASRDHERAAQVLRDVLRRHPDEDLKLLLAECLDESWFLDAAHRMYRQLLKTSDRADRVHSGLSGIALRLGKPAAAVDHLRRALELRPGRARHSVLARMLHHDPRASRASILEEHRAWGVEYARASGEPPRRRQSRKRLRVAYFSGIFAGHAAIFRPILRHHNRSRFEIVCLADEAMPEDMRFPCVETSRMTNAQVADLIRKMEIDLLVECDGHYRFGARLPVFAARPAPVQISLPMYHGSLGLDSIGFRVTDGVVDPPAHPALTPERLLRLPMYMPFPTLDSGRQGKTRGRTVLFGAFSAISKINDRVIACWAEILRQVPGSRLLIHHYLDRHDRTTVNVTVQRRLETAFEIRGIGPDRLAFQGALPASRHLSLWNTVDVALDPFPHNGTLTTLNALSQCVPVVTLAGSTSAGRAGASLLSAVGLAGLVAADQEQYCRKAAAIGSDPSMRSRCRRRIREVLGSGRLDGREYVKSLEAAYLEAWERESR